MYINGHYYLDKVINESYTFIEEKSNKYDPPYSKEDVLKKYGNDTYNRLSKDPAHRFRMDTGIELIHQEPSKEELIRIYNNWQLMPNSMKKKSDQKSIELFGKDNETHFKYLMDTIYNESYTPYKGGVKMNTINNLANIARKYGITESGNLRDDIVSEYTDIIKSLNIIDESVINKDISLLPIYKINEGYTVDLDSLKYVVESKKITLAEAIQEIKDVNYIGDTYPMYCVLPENINENMSLESFITLNESLNKSGITPMCIREYSEEEFINEGLTIETWSEPKVRKTLDKYEETLKELKKKKEDFQKMSDKEQKKYCVEKAVKNIVIGTIISIPTLFLGGAVYNTYTTMKGDNTILGPKNYVAGLNNLIAAYKVDINRLNKRLKELEKGNK